MNLCNGKKIRFFLLSIITMSVLLISGCATESQAWQEAVKNDTVENYNAFLEEYPDGEYSQEANSAIEKILWKKAYQTFTVEAFEEYLLEYPKGEFTREAKRCKENAELMERAFTDTYFEEREALRREEEETKTKYEKFSLAMAPVVKGIGVEEAGVYIPGQPNTNKVFVILKVCDSLPGGKISLSSRQGSFLNPISWNDDYLPPHWSPSSVNDINLLLVCTYVDFIELDSIGYGKAPVFNPDGRYEGIMVERTYHRVRLIMRAELREANTGKMLRSKDFSAEPESFPHRIYPGTVDIREYVEPEEVMQWVAEIIEP